MKVNHNEIKRLRLSKGWSQEQLAIATWGVANRSTISQYEAGKCAPTLSNLAKLANALGCKLTDLIA